AVVSVGLSVVGVWVEMPVRFLGSGGGPGLSGSLFRRGPEPWASWTRHPASAYHGDQRWRGCAGTQGGALRLSALSDAAQAVAVVCPGDVSRGLEKRRDGASGAGLLRQVSQRVCGPCAAG